MQTFLVFFLSFIFLSNSYATCRSSKVKRMFLRQQGYNSQPKNTVVDHICPLACGGLDIISNMQIQTKEDSLKKDKWERTTFGCKSLCNKDNSKSTRTVYNCK